MIAYLFVGGPRHGEFVGVRADVHIVSVPIMPPMKAHFCGMEGCRCSETTIKRGEYERTPMADRIAYLYRGER